MPQSLCGQAAQRSSRGKCQPNPKGPADFGPWRCCATGPVARATEPAPRLARLPKSDSSANVGIAQCFLWSNRAKKKLPLPYQSEGRVASSGRNPRHPTRSGPALTYRLALSAGGGEAFSGPFGAKRREDGKSLSSHGTGLGAFPITFWPAQASVWPDEPPVQQGQPKTSTVLTSIQTSFLLQGCGRTGSRHQPSVVVMVLVIVITVHAIA